LSATSALLAIALIWPPTASNVSSAPPWETLPAEQPLSAVAMEGYVDHDGARIWYGMAGKGEPVVHRHDEADDCSITPANEGHFLKV